MNEFQPNKYIILKTQDVEDALGIEGRLALASLLCLVETMRVKQGKVPFRDYICVSESDQNYDVVKKATVNQEKLCISLQGWPISYSGVF